MDTYEVEVKSLLGSAEAAVALRQRLPHLDPEYILVGTGSQLNHYFTGGGALDLYHEVASLLGEEDRAGFARIAAGRGVSVRTRRTDDAVLLVLKASIDDATSENGVARIELERSIPSHSIDELDARVLRSGYRYQAKWSRDREEYRVRGLHLTVDRNAGYGYVAELEEVVDSPAEVALAQGRIRGLMTELGLVELPQDRLERMFAYYNDHWAEYYGTDRTFTVL